MLQFYMGLSPKSPTIVFDGAFKGTRACTRECINVKQAWQS